MTAAPNPKLDRIAAICRALAERTTANGCTESEAIDAAAKLAELLAKYNLTEDEISLRENRFQRHREATEDTVGDRLWKVADGASYLTGCRSWTQREGRTEGIVFFGFEHEVMVARYMFEICAWAMRSERARLVKAYAILTESARRRKIIPFLDGMADGLRRRLRAMKPLAPTGTGLVVLRDQLITAAMAEAGIKLHDVNHRRGRDFEPAYDAGQQAAGRVQLNPGLAGSSQQARIGNR